MVDGSPVRLRYRAFLSYSHKDEAIAARLHRRLETYRLPRRLVGRETERGRVPDRLLPIFRDREEFAASSDLSEAVRAGLADSEALIVLCSPAAAQSRWVAEEIRVFRSLHPGAPVLAAIVARDPPACFPEPLLTGPAGAASEPLATDLRREGDGQHLGLLKLVAGVTGLPLDDLVQRDASRRIRRVTAVTVGALVAVLLMAALTVLALDARREAERQRAEAEGLIEFMLTDLRDRLRGVGRLDAMDTVNRRALAYYGGQRELAQLTDESLGRRVRILQSIGDDNLDRHDLTSAYAVFREAHLATSELLKRAPMDARRIAEHAKSEAGLGRVHEARNEWATAQQHFVAFANAAERLINIAPHNPEHMMKIASSAVGLGNVQLRWRRDYVAAQHFYERALHWFGRAARLRPDDRHIRMSEANAYGWLADTFWMRRLWHASLAARLRQHSIVEGLHRAQPDDAEIGFRLAAAERGVASSFVRVGDRTNARIYFFQAYATVARLTNLEPANAEWRRLKTLLSRDLVEARLGFPPGVTSTQLRSAIHHDAASTDTHH